MLARIRSARALLTLSPRLWRGGHLSTGFSSGDDTLGTQSFTHATITLTALPVRIELISQGPYGGAELPRWEDVAQLVEPFQLNTF